MRVARDNAPELGTLVRTLSMLSLVRNRQTRRFFLAHFQSQLGTGAAYVALVLVGYERFHRGLGVALVLLADVVPGIALSALCGALADRLSRTRLAVVADLIRAGAFLGLAAVSSFGATIALALVAGVGTALFRPAVGAALPGLVSEDQRSPAMALYNAIANLGLTAGPALTALVLLFSTPELVLTVNGITFLVSALLLSRVALGRAQTSAADADETVWQSTRAGARAARQSPDVAGLLLIGGMTVFAGAVMNVAEPLLATGPLGAGKAGYSLLVAVYGTGLVAGSLVCARAGNALGRLRWVWMSGYALCGLGMLASALSPNLAAAACAFALTGAANALIVSPELRLFQEMVSGGLLGRVLGLRDLLQNAALLAAFGSAGVVLSPLGPRAAFAAGGTAMLVLTVLAARTLTVTRVQSTPVAESVSMPAFDTGSLASGTNTQHQTAMPTT